MKKSTPEPKPQQPPHTIEDIVRAAHAAGAEMSIALVPKSGVEATILRAIEIQQTLLHGLEAGMGKKAAVLLIQATISTLYQARGELPKPTKPQA